MNKILIWLAGILFLVGLGVIIGYSFGKSALPGSCQTAFRYLNESAVCNGAAVIDKKSYSEFVIKLKEYISLETTARKLSDVSLFFRDLNHGPTFGINENVQFVPASLLKLPILLVYLDLAEGDPEILKRQLVYKAVQLLIPQNFEPQETVQEGQPYSRRTSPAPKK